MFSFITMEMIGKSCGMNHTWSYSMYGINFRYLTWPKIIQGLQQAIFTFGLHRMIIIFFTLAKESVIDAFTDAVNIVILHDSAFGSKYPLTNANKIK